MACQSYVGCFANCCGHGIDRGRNWPRGVFGDSLGQIGVPPMCNLYSVTTNQEAMRRIARAFRDSLGNQPSLPAIFPDQLAPVVRLDANGGRTLDLLWWGLARPPYFKLQRASKMPP